jgi:hypothetical protein
MQYLSQFRFLEKTKVEWKNRAEFKAVTGSYYPVKLHFSRPPRKPEPFTSEISGETTEESEDELMIDTETEQTPTKTEEQFVEQKSIENQQLNAQTSIQSNNSSI